MNRRQEEEIARAADRFADAAKELTATLNRFLEFQELSWKRFEAYQHSLSEPDRELSLRDYRQRWEQPGGVVLGFLGAGGLPEDEAGVLADDLVHRVRGEFLIAPNQPVPSPEEIRDWEHRREERRRLEGD